MKKIAIRFVFMVVGVIGLVASSALVAAPASADEEPSAWCTAVWYGEIFYEVCVPVPFFSTPPVPGL